MFRESIQVVLDSGEAARKLNIVKPAHEDRLDPQVTKEPGLIFDQRRYAGYVVV